MSYVATNKASSTLAANINASATAITVVTGEGDRFPSPTGGDYTLVTLQNASGVREIVCIVGRTADVLTVGVPGSAAADAAGRNYEAIYGMSAASWVIGDVISVRPTVALVKAGVNYGATFAAGTSKAAPVDADMLGLYDSAAPTTATKLSWANLKAALFGSGLAVSGGVFSSRGITDNATAKALTLSGSGANSVTIANSASNPAINTSAGALVLGSQTFPPALWVQSITGGVTYIRADSTAAGGLAYLTAEGETNTGLALSSSGTGSIYLQTNNRATTQVAVLDTPGAVNFITLTGSNGGNPTIGISGGTFLKLSAPALLGANAADYFEVSGGTGGAALKASGSSTNVQSGYISKGTAGHAFYTNNDTTHPQFLINNTTSANRYVIVTGSNGGNPTISTNVGNVQIGEDGSAARLVLAAADGVNEGGELELKGAGVYSAMNLDNYQGNLRFYNSTGATQVVISNTASANRYITLTGSNSGNPTIGVSGGTLALSAGALSTSATNGLGYGTGAGGAVTQATDKSTAVTLDKSCGQITTSNATLAAGASVIVPVNNSLVTATDLVVAHTSGAGGNYRVSVLDVGSGVFYMQLTNIAGGDRSEAVVINFAVIKAVAA